MKAPLGARCSLPAQGIGRLAPSLAPGWLVGRLVRPLQRPLTTHHLERPAVESRPGPAPGPVPHLCQVPPGSWPPLLAACRSG